MMLIWAIAVGVSLGWWQPATPFMLLIGTLLLALRVVSDILFPVNFVTKLPSDYIAYRIRTGREGSALNYFIIGFVWSLIIAAAAYGVVRVIR